MHRLKTCRSLKHGKINKMVILLFIVLACCAMCPIRRCCGTVCLIECINLRFVDTHYVQFFPRLVLEQKFIIVLHTHFVHTYNNGNNKIFKSLISDAMNGVNVKWVHYQNYKCINEPYTRIASRVRQCSHLAVDGMRAQVYVFFSFTWILSFCTLFFAECLNKGKQIWLCTCAAE